MTNEKTISNSSMLHLLEALFSLLVAIWYLVTFLSQAAFKIIPVVMPFTVYKDSPAIWVFISIIIGYGILVLCVLKLVSFFLRGILPAITRAEQILPLSFNILISGWVLFNIAVYVLKRVTSISDLFVQVDLFAWIMILAAFAHNIFFVATLISTINQRNARYREYLIYQHKLAGTKKELPDIVVNEGIQKRLVISFIGLIIVLIFVLSFILIREFSSSILAVITNTGITLSEGSSSFLRTNVGEISEAEVYFKIEREKNDRSLFKYDSASFFIKRAGRYVAVASTNDQLVKEGVGLELESYTFTTTQVFHQPKKKIYEFVSPILIGKDKKLIGFTNVIYKESVIYEPVFRTQIKVVFFSLVFIYLSCLIVYIIGFSIVFPLLYLRMNVNLIGNTLDSMIKGKQKVSADLIEYKEAITTKDEIKSLSVEIKSMTGVIRGIIPYISASTLMHADRDNPKTNERELTFLFTDIRGFTTLCEGMTPHDVVEILNRYLDLQASIIIRNNGDIDKFVGDEVMAMFDGPEKEVDACRAAMEIMTAMAAEKAAREAQNMRAVNIGIGINTGHVVFGSVGAKDRMDFTSIGDTVNLAARLEGANKEYGTKSLITEAVYNRVKDVYVCRELDYMTVKGKKEPVRIFEILIEKGSSSRALSVLKENFERGLSQYRNQNWDEAINIFHKQFLEYNDESSVIFKRRCEFFKANPPDASWDGVFRLNVK